MKELAIPTPKDGEGTRCRTAAFSKTAAPAAINISFIFFLPHLCLHHFSVFAAQLHQLLMGSRFAMVPCFKRRIKSAFRMVDRRWAMAMMVLVPAI